MKKCIPLILVMLMAIPDLRAQNDKVQFKEAKKQFSIYQIDPEHNSDKLNRAAAAIDAALAENGSVSKEAGAWSLQGEIYNEIAQQIITARHLNTGKADGLSNVKMPAVSASEAYKKALKFAGKKYEIKEALDGLKNVQLNLGNLGIYAYEDGNYSHAYMALNEVLEIHEILKEQQEASMLASEADYKRQLYITGLAALNAGKSAEAEMMFTPLYQANYSEPAIYEALYKIKAQRDIEKAYPYLKMGLEKYPDDISLLFAEINHLLQTNQLQPLISKIKTAIQREPDNVTLYATLGNVYDRLYQQAYAEGNQEISDKYFSEAKNYYKQAISRDPGNYDAHYSLGALYYNKAAYQTQELQALADDLSEEGLKKYDVIKQRILKSFEEALPYFKEAERLNPNDVNTLIALKEIYFQQGNLELALIFKERLNKVQNGGRVSGSYFANEED